jgi:hypothetical protein
VLLLMEKEVGESYTEGDEFAKEEEWGPIDNRGEKEEKERDKEGDIGSRKERRGSKAAATTRHDGGGGRKWGRVIRR